MAGQPRGRRVLGLGAQASLPVRAHSSGGGHRASGEPQFRLSESIRVNVFAAVNMTSNKTLEQKLKRGKNVNVVIRKPNVFTEDKKGENNKFPPLSDYLGNMLKEPRMTYS